MVRLLMKSSTCLLYTSIAGGMLFSFTLFTGHIENGAIIPSNQFWQNVYSLGIAGFSMMVPVICGYIAYAIAGKPALAPGLIMGYVANNPIGEEQLSTGSVSYTHLNRNKVEVILC